MWREDPEYVRLPEDLLIDLDLFDFDFELFLFLRFVERPRWPRLPRSAPLCTVDILFYCKMFFV